VRKHASSLLREGDLVLAKHDAAVVLVSFLWFVFVLVSVGGLVGLRTGVVVAAVAATAAGELLAALSLLVWLHLG